MNHLVIAVSADSSLELLGKYADVIVLDKEPLPAQLKSYESVYIRSHFSTPELSPENFRAEIEILVEQAKAQNQAVTFVDGMETVDAIVRFEDKWLQYVKFSEFMPSTVLLDSSNKVAELTRPIYKKRLSSRGNGVTWNSNEVAGEPEGWIAQESLTIAEEMRVYVINGEAYPVGALRYSMTNEQKAQAIDSRHLSVDEIEFATKVGKKAPGLDMIGLDIARTADGELLLLEVNRSPGFGAFANITDVNLADALYKDSA